MLAKYTANLVHHAECHVQLVVRAVLLDHHPLQLFLLILLDMSAQQMRFITSLGTKNKDQNEGSKQHEIQFLELPLWPQRAA